MELEGNNATVVEEIDLAAKLVETQKSLEAANAAREKEEKARKQAENALINFRTPNPVEVLEKASVYAKQLKGIKGDVTNREYIDLAVKYREAVLLEKGIDVFGDSGVQSAETVATAAMFKQLLEENPSSSAFNYQMQEALQDDPRIAQMFPNKRKR